MPRGAILASTVVGLGLGLSAYAWAGGPPHAQAIPPFPPPMVVNPAPPSSDPMQKSYVEQTRRDDLRQAEIRSHWLEGKLPPGSDEARNLEWSLSQAQRRLDDYRLSREPSDAQVKRQTLDDALRDVERSRQRAEDRVNGLR